MIATSIAWKLTDVVMTPVIRAGLLPMVIPAAAPKPKATAAPAGKVTIPWGNSKDVAPPVKNGTDHLVDNVLYLASGICAVFFVFFFIRMLTGHDKAAGKCGLALIGMIVFLAPAIFFNQAVQIWDSFMN